jgi:hypothetical protein
MLADRRHFVFVELLIASYEELTAFLRERDGGAAFASDDTDAALAVLERLPVRPAAPAFGEAALSGDDRIRAARAVHKQSLLQGLHPDKLWGNAFAGLDVAFMAQAVRSLAARAEGVLAGDTDAAMEAVDPALPNRRLTGWGGLFAAPADGGAPTLPPSIYMGSRGSQWEDSDRGRNDCYSGRNGGH